jgi:hypothetical protein
MSRIIGIIFNKPVYVLEIMNLICWSNPIIKISTMNAFKRKTGPYHIFLVLGFVWVTGGLVIFQNSNIWPLGFLFLIIGFIGLASKKRSGKDSTPRP